MAQREPGYFSRNFPKFHDVFDPRVYLASTLIRKRVHLELHAKFIHEVMYSGEEIFDYSRYVQDTSACDLLRNLKEWAIQLALSGLTLQIIWGNR